MRRIVRESGITGDDVVLEVGPGLGSLTLALLDVARRVIAVELDEKLASLLPETVAAYAPDQADRFEVVHADALRVTELPGPPPTALVANLPYNVSVPVLLHLLALLPSLERGLVMVQAEVADRLAAGPGSKVYGIPSVKAAWFADVRRAGTVGRNVFWPAPNVDSGLVAWTRRDPPADHRDPRAGLRGGRRGVRPATQGVAGCAARPGRIGRARDRCPGAGRCRAVGPWRVAGRHRVREDRRVLGGACRDHRARGRQDQPASRRGGAPRRRVPSAEHRLPGGRTVRRPDRERDDRARRLGAGAERVGLGRRRRGAGRRPQHRLPRRRGAGRPPRSAQ